MKSRNIETDILATTALLIVYYFSSCTLLLLSGIVAALSPDLETTIPVSGETLNTIYTAGSSLLGNIPTAMVVVLILIVPLITTTRSIYYLRKNPEGIKEYCVENSIVPIMYAFTGCLLPQIAYLCAAYIGSHLGFAHLIPDIFFNCSYISFAVLITFALYFVPNICVLILSCKKKSHGKEQI